MERRTINTGLLGLTDEGQHLLRAAVDSGYFQIVALADQNHQRTERAAAEYHCEGYTDYRQLIVQNQLDCLLVAADIHTCDEHIKAAIRKKFNILKLAPPARDFEEALELARMAENEGIQFAVANPSRFRSSAVTAMDLLSRGAIEQIFLITGCCQAAAPDRPAWYADPKLAGGGVLLRDCYELIDQILCSFPLPQQIYALNTSLAPDKQQRLYRTEDTSLVSMRFTDILVGSLVATRCGGLDPNTTSLQICAKEAQLTVTRQEVILRTGGAAPRDWPCHDSDDDVMARLLESFALSVLGRDEHPLVSSLAENLRNMAVLQSAYLSARTGFPEEPLRILQMAGNLAAPGARV